MSSLHELAELREQIIRIKDDENVPIVIVGNKSDLEDERKVSRQKAFSTSQSWGNAPYYETSARRRANVDEVFIDLCRQIIRREGTYSYDYDEEDEEEEENYAYAQPGASSATYGISSHNSSRHRGHKKRHHRSHGKKKKKKHSDCVIL